MKNKKKQNPQTQSKKGNSHTQKKKKQLRVALKSEVSQQDQCLLQRSKAILSALSFLKCEELSPKAYHRRSIKVVQMLLDRGKSDARINAFVTEIRQKRLINFNNMKISNQTIDFHSYSAPQLKKTIDLLKQKGPQNTRIITGKGIHSNGKQVLKPILMLNLKEYQIEQLSNGLIILRKK